MWNHCALSFEIWKIIIKGNNKKAQQTNCVPDTLIGHNEIAILKTAILVSAFCQQYQTQVLGWTHIYTIVKTESYLLFHWKLWIFYENSSVVFKSSCQWNLVCSFIQIQIEFLIRTQEFSTRELPGVALVNCTISHIFNHFS